MLKPKKKTLRTWLKEHKGVVIGTGSFLLAGLLALLIGFEIKTKGHAIRNFLASPHAATLIILIVVGIFLVGLFVLSLVYMKKGDE